MSTLKTGNDFDSANIAGAEQVKESYRAALQEEPRAMIDDAIRAAARRAVASAPTSLGKRWTARWTTPLAAAATVMLTSSVIFMAVRDRPEMAPPIANMVVLGEAAKVAPSEVEKNAVAPKPGAESDAADKRADFPAPAFVGNDQPRELTQAKEKKSSAAEAERAPAITRAQDNANRVMQTPSATATPPPQKASPAPAKQIAPSVELSGAAPAAPPFVPPTGARKVLNEAKAESASNLSAQDATRRKQSDSEATAALTAEATGKVVPPPPTAVSVAPAPAPPQARALAKPAPAPEPVMPRADANATTPSIAAAPISDALEKPSAITQRAITASSEKADKIEPADAWIKRMTELKRQDKTKQLADEIARFRKQYPAVELPKEITETQD
jgi:hypothetical protein